MTRPRTYAAGGVGYLVCPRLLELDPRHGQHHSHGPNCRRGRPCKLEHEHEEQLFDPEGHQATTFIWAPGSLHADEHSAELTCQCGRRLIHGDLDNPWASSPQDGRAGSGEPVQPIGDTANGEK